MAAVGTAPAGRAADPVLSVRRLGFTYAEGRGPALRQIDLEVSPGEFVVVTGPSGCGKSTLAFCLTGFIPHGFPGTMHGSVVVGGRDTLDHSPAALAGIVGLVQQDPETQLCTLAVVDEVAFGPENLCLPSSEVAQRVDWALEAVGAAHLRRRSVHTLSGGEKQRVAIASVLAMEPSLLILDEPTANLDPRCAADVLTAIEGLRRRRGTALIVIEHRLRRLLPICDRLVVIEEGRIAADAPPGAVPTTAADPPPGAAGPPHAGTAEPSPDAAPLLQVSGLTVTRDDVPVLRDVTFSIRRGEVVALMGDNGCGKTTLLHALLGLVPAGSGRIRLGDDDITRQKAVRRARAMGLTFQNPNHQLFGRTVAAELRLPAQRLGDGKPDGAGLERLLDRFDLLPYRETIPFALSLGEKKRVCLASVLGYRPPLLLLDEPFIGQDRGRLDTLRRALDDHAGAGGAALLVCHEPSLARAFCRRVLFLDRGRLIVDAGTGEAFAALARLGRDEYLPDDYARGPGTDCRPDGGAG